jgi:RNA polymerase sigma-70 factor (ECF subfamily)
MQDDERALTDAKAVVADRPTESERRAADARFDRAIVSRILDRDVGALELAYARYGKPIWSLARRVAGDDGIAEEVVQEAFLRLWTRASDYDPERGRLLPWLLTIAHHRTIDEVRRRRARGEIEGLDTELVTVEAPDADPVDTAIAHDDRKAIHTALAALPDPQRQAIELAYVGGYSQTEIARHLEVPLGTIKTRMRLALRKLRDLLGDRRSTNSDHDRSATPAHEAKE